MTNFVKNRRIGESYYMKFKGLEWKDVVSDIMIIKKSVNYILENKKKWGGWLGNFI